MEDRNKKLSSLLKPVSQEQASYQVFVRATYYPNFVRVYIPNKPYEKLIAGMESPPKLRRKLINNSDLYESNVLDTIRSIRRTVKAVRDYSLCNQFELFPTFTFKKERGDVDKCKSKMSNWLKNERKRKGNFEYLIVPEFHKKCEDCANNKVLVCPHDNEPKPIHFHALFKGYKGEIVEAIHPETGLQIIKRKRPVFDFPSYRSGHCEVYKIEDTPESHAKVGNYVGKYITKDMPLFHGKNRYWHSVGLVKPLVQENPEPWYESIEPLREYETEYGIFRDYPSPPALSVWAGEKISFFNGNIPEFTKRDLEV